MYRMDSMDVGQKHRDSSADITISCITIGDNRAFVSGLIKIDDKGQVLHFCEKPKGNNTYDVIRGRAAPTASTARSLKPRNVFVLVKST